MFYCKRSCLFSFYSSFSRKTVLPLPRASVKTDSPRGFALSIVEASKQAVTSQAVCTSQTQVFAKSSSLGHCQGLLNGLPAWYTSWSPPIPHSSVLTSSGSKAVVFKELRTCTSKMFPRGQWPLFKNHCSSVNLHGLDSLFDPLPLQGSNSWGSSLELSVPQITHTSNGDDSIYLTEWLLQCQHWAQRELNTNHLSYVASTGRGPTENASHRIKSKPLNNGAKSRFTIFSLATQLQKAMTTVTLISQLYGHTSSFSHLNSPSFSRIYFLITIYI